MSDLPPYLVAHLVQHAPHADTKNFPEGLLIERRGFSPSVQPTTAWQFDQVLGVARAENLLSDEHFSVDGTLPRAWASQARATRLPWKKARCA